MTATMSPVADEQRQPVRMHHVARRLGVSPNTVWRWHGKLGGLAGHVGQGHRITLDDDDVRRIDLAVRLTRADVFGSGYGGLRRAAIVARAAALLDSWPCVVIVDGVPHGAIDNGDAIDVWHCHGSKPAWFVERAKLLTCADVRRALT